jgi:hypothetical protein
VTTTHNYIIAGSGSRLGWQARHASNIDKLNRLDKLELFQKTIEAKMSGKKIMKVTDKRTEVVSEEAIWRIQDAHPGRPKRNYTGGKEDNGKYIQFCSNRN